MFNTATYALTWSLLKKHQWGLVALVFLIPLLLLVKFVLSQFFPAELIQALTKFHILVLVTIMPYILLVFTMADISTHQIQQGFPKYTFVHPVSSTKLALVPILSGILFTSLFIIVWLELILGKSLMLHQLLVILFTTAGTISWLQMIGWRFSRSPYLSTWLMLILVAIDFSLVVSTWGTEKFTALIPQPFSSLGLLLLPISGIWLAINSVKAARTNSTEGKIRYLSNIGFIGFNLPKSYRSISQALFRYEWRVFGWILPMAGTFIISLLIFIAIQKGVDEKLLDIMGIMSLTLIYLPSFLPTEISKSDLSIGGGKANHLSSFIASLPVSNFDLATAKLTLLVRSTLLLHIMILLTINFLIFNFSDHFVIDPWLTLSSKFGYAQAILTILGINLMYPIITWVIGGNTLSWCLKGERFLIARRIVMIAFGLLLIVPLGFSLYTTDEFRSLIFSYLPWLNVVAFIIITMIFMRAWKKFKAVCSLESLRITLIIAASLFTFFVYSLYSVNVISVENPQLILVLLDLMLLGILPFLTSPLSIAENRSG